MPNANEPQADGEAMKELWIKAEKDFEKICGRSLDEGGIRSFDDLQKKIEQAQFVDETADRAQKTISTQAKEVGLVSLQCLRALVNVADQASSLIPFPKETSKMVCSALTLVFDIPRKIKGYENAISAVFGEVASVLVQFKIYESVEGKLQHSLLQQIHLVMVSFVKVCAHVVKYQQGSKWTRARQKIKSIFDDDSGLRTEMSELNRLIKSQHDIEGTMTLCVALKLRQDTVDMLNRLAMLSTATSNAGQNVQSLKEKADHGTMLSNIRDVLGVSSTVHLDKKTTETCNAIVRRCSDGTGTWIWGNQAYTTWIGAKSTQSAKQNPYILLVSGPSCSGKTLASALIVKSLEEKHRNVAHYFFPASGKRSDDDKRPVQSALKYMAFQLARVDAAVLKNLAKACGSGSAAQSRLQSSSSDMHSLWADLKIDTPGSDAAYYLVFDGLENLPERQVTELLDFASDTRVTRGSGRVRILVSGSDEEFGSHQVVDEALRIRMELYNEQDMRTIVDSKLNEQQVLLDAKSNSIQLEARDKIIKKLPKMAKGSYSSLQRGLDNVVSLLSSRTRIEDLDSLLSQSINSLEVAIKSLQRSLTAEEINDLNELLKWVVYAFRYMTLSQLEAVMCLHSGFNSIVSLQQIIAKKYCTILKVEDNYVYEQDGIIECLQKEKAKSFPSDKDQPTITMSITVNNVDQQLCGHFFWDLAREAIRDNLRFDIDAASNTLHNTQATIDVNEFEAHHSIVTTTFDYLLRPRVDVSDSIGWYLACYLPKHLEKLSDLEREDTGTFDSNAKIKIGQSLYELFDNDEVFERHKKCFEVVDAHWTTEEMMSLQNWVMDRSVVKKLDKRWLDTVQRARTPTKGLLRLFAETAVKWFLRERDFSVISAYEWVTRLMASDQDPPPELPSDAFGDARFSSSAVSENDGVYWDKISEWCRDFMRLANTDLDSLWYERLADAALELKQPSEVIKSLYKRALNMENPSWVCHRDFGQALFSWNETGVAILQVELALQKTSLDNVNPKAEPNDILGLKLKLADMNYKMNDYQNSATNYECVCTSKDKTQAAEGRLGLFKAKLSFLDEAETRALLHDTVSPGDADQHQRFVSLIKMAAGDAECDYILTRILAVAKVDHRLLVDVVRALETATIDRHPHDDMDPNINGRTAQTFAEDKASSVLLYYRGIAAHTYGVGPDGTEPAIAAVELWEQCRKKLEGIGGETASSWRRRATEELAKHYFQTMMNPTVADECEPDQIERLRKLYDIDAAELYSVGSFLGSLYALHDRKDKSKAVLRHRMLRGLTMLSDDDPDNDIYGIAWIFCTLLQNRDFKNSAVALSLLGQQDIVTQELSYAVKGVPVDDSGVNRNEVNELINEVNELITDLGAETVQKVKSQFPQVAQQIERIKAAKAHIDSLLAEQDSTDETDMDADSGAQVEKKTGIGARKVALKLLRSRLANLEHLELDATMIETRLTCDGRKSNGRACGDENHSFNQDLYHCIYCPAKDFCADCLGRLRGVTPGDGSLSSNSLSAPITACSSKHQWFKIPAAFSDMYVGTKPDMVRRPNTIRLVPGDDSVWEACYDEADATQMTMDEWKTELARDWDISLNELNSHVA